MIWIGHWNTSAMVVILTMYNNKQYIAITVGLKPKLKLIRYDATITTTQPHDSTYKVLTNANNVFSNQTWKARNVKKVLFVRVQFSANTRKNVKFIIIGHVYILKEFGKFLLNVSFLLKTVFLTFCRNRNITYLHVLHHIPNTAG